MAGSTSDADLLPLSPPNNCDSLDHPAGNGLRAAGSEAIRGASLASVGLVPAPSRALFSGNTAGAALLAAAARVAKINGHVPHAARHLTVGRSVAQPGSALASGARGREFESPRSDQYFACL
jgi:hypothetical protein